MAVVSGPNIFGFFTNGDLRKGDNSNFILDGFIPSQSSYVANGGPDGGPYLEFTGGNGRSGASEEFFEVDTSKTYQMITYAKTITEGSVSDPEITSPSVNGKLAGGHLGFSCYDSSKRWIDLRHCGGLGNTELSQPLSDGDTHFYLKNNFTTFDISAENTQGDGWTIGADVTSMNSIYRHVILFPASHPEYGTPYEYSRIGFRGGSPHSNVSDDGYTLCYKSLEFQTDTGDWKGKLCDKDDNDITFSSASAGIDGVIPANTPVSRGAAGGSYNYAAVNEANLNRRFDYPLTWTKFSCAPFTGESRNSATPFRFATKYVKFLILKNYIRRNVAPHDHVYGISQMFFGEVLDNKDYRNNL